MADFLFSGDVVFLFLFIQSYASLLFSDPGASPGSKEAFCAAEGAKKLGNKKSALGRLVTH